MTNEQFPNAPQGSHQRNLVVGAWNCARGQIAAGLAAHVVASVLTVFVSPAPLLTAIAATLAFAATWLYFSHGMLVGDRVASPSALRNLYAVLFTTAAILVGAWMITAVVGNASTFYCTPAIPWRIEIALFGSFAIGLLDKLPRPRGLSVLAYPLTMLALLWVAPFYGYFSGAIFFGIGLTLNCPDHSFVQFCLAALGMVGGNALGTILAGWLLKAPDARRPK